MTFPHAFSVNVVEMLIYVYLSWQRSPNEGHLFSIMNYEWVTITNNGLFKNNNHSPFFSSFFFQLLLRQAQYKFKETKNHDNKNLPTRKACSTARFIVVPHARQIMGFMPVVWFYSAAAPTLIFPHNILNQDL